MHLVLSVGELQVDGGTRAEQTMGFGLYILSDRRDADVEPLNELHRNQNTCHFNSNTLSMRAFISGCTWIHLKKNCEYVCS